MNIPQRLNSKISGVSFGKNITIVEPSNIYECEISDEVFIGPFVEIQKDVFIGKRTKVQSHTFICSLVTIGDNVFIGHSVMTVNDINPPSFKRTGSKSEWKETKICDNAVVGSGCVIFPVRIGTNSVVGAGSVVTEDVPDNTKVAGTPAKIIGKV